MTKKIYPLQDIAAPDGVCFGCGSKNANGLQIKSYWDADNAHVTIVIDPYFIIKIISHHLELVGQPLPNKRICFHQENRQAKIQK